MLFYLKKYVTNLINMCIMLSGFGFTEKALAKTQSRKTANSYLKIKDSFSKLCRNILYYAIK